MELSTLKQSDFTDLAEIKFLQALDSVDQSMRESGIVQTINIPKNSGDTRKFSEIELEEYATKKDEGDQSDRANVQQGYSKIMENYRISKDIGITYEMRNHNKYQKVVRRLTSLGKLAPNRMDLDLSHRLSFATSTSYTDMDADSVDISVGDGKALAASDHTLKGSSTTFRNQLANNPQLSKGAIQAARRLVTEETYNQFGEKMTMPFDILFTTDDPVAVDTAQEYLQSSSAPEGAHSGIKNVLQGKFTHVVLPRLATDANGAPDSNKRNYWGIVSSKYSTFYLGVWEAPHLKTPSAGNNGEEFSTDNWNYGVRAGYGICIPSANWIKFSKGDGSA